MKLISIRNSLVVISAVLLLALWGVMMSQYSAYDQASVKLEKQQAELNSKKQEIADIKNAVERYKAEKEEFLKLLFDERDVPTFLDQIAQYAKQAGINIVDMKTQKFFQVQIPKDISQAAKVDQRLSKQVESRKKEDEQARMQTLSAMPIQIRVKGNFESQVRFLDYLQEYKQLINIANVQIKAGNEYPLLDCEFIIRIYTLKTMKELRLK